MKEIILKDERTEEQRAAELAAWGAKEVAVTLTNDQWSTLPVSYL